MAFGVLFNELFYCQIWKLVGNGCNQINCVKLDEYYKYKLGVKIKFKGLKTLLKFPPGFSQNAVI